MPEKNIRFFSEYILVTVVSLIAATLWINVCKDYVPESIVSRLILATIVTVASILALCLISKKPVIPKKLPSNKELKIAELERQLKAAQTEVTL